MIMSPPSSAAVTVHVVPLVSNVPKLLGIVSVSIFMLDTIKFPNCSLSIAIFVLSAPSFAFWNNPPFIAKLIVTITSISIIIIVITNAINVMPFSFFIFISPFLFILYSIFWKVLNKTLHHR